MSTTDQKEEKKKLAVINALNTVGNKDEHKGRDIYSQDKKLKFNYRRIDQKPITLNELKDGRAFKKIVASLDKTYSEESFIEMINLDNDLLMHSGSTNSSDAEKYDKPFLKDLFSQLELIKTEENSEEVNKANPYLGQFAGQRRRKSRRTRRKPGKRRCTKRRGCKRRKTRR